MQQKYLSNASLKMLAILFMLIDHIGATGLYTVFTPSEDIYYLLRIIGRLAFPIFAFLIAEGYYYTKNMYRYFTRLMIFAFISEIPFDLAFSNKMFDFTSQNVFFTLSLGLLAILLFDKYKDSNLTISYLSLSVIGLLAILLRTDYHMIGIIIIFCFYYFRHDYIRLTISISFINLMLAFEPLLELMKTGVFEIQSVLQIFSLFSLFLIYCYNGKKGRQFKYFFYMFYPVHLFVLYILNKLFEVE